MKLIKNIEKWKSFFCSFIFLLYSIVSTIKAENDVQIPLNWVRIIFSFTESNRNEINEKYWKMKKFLLFLNFPIVFHCFRNKSLRQCLNSIKFGPFYFFLVINQIKMKLIKNIEKWKCFFCSLIFLLYSIVFVIKAEDNVWIP